MGCPDYFTGHDRCEQGTGDYNPSKCFNLQAARVGVLAGINLMVATIVVASLLSFYVIKMRMEPTMARISAIFSGGCPSFP